MSSNIPANSPQLFIFHNLLLFIGLRNETFYKTCDPSDNDSSRQMAMAKLASFINL